MMKIRRAALDRIGERTIRTGAPMTTIEEPLVPIYMHHRYAVESAASMIAGQDFVYAMRGDGRTPTKWETAANQRQALEALAATLKPSELTIPRKILDSIPPRPPGYGLHRELFPRTTGEAFDPLGPATVAADVTIGFVLQHDRAARMVAQNAVDPTLPGLGEVIDRLTKATFDAVTTLAVRSGGAARDRARAGRSRDVAGDGGAERPGARDRVDEAAAARHTAANDQRQGRAGRRAAHAARGQHHALPRASGGSRARDAAAKRAAGSADWRCRPELAGRRRLVRLGRESVRHRA